MYYLFAHSKLCSFLMGGEKMKIEYKIVAASLIFAACASQVMAENYYGALDIGQAKGSDICTGNPPSISGCEDTATAFRIAGGYQFSPNWGAEVSYADYGSGSVGSGNIGAPFGNVSGNWKATALEIAGVGTLPISGGFSLTGKLGLTSTDIKVDINSSSLGSISESNTTSKLTFGVGAKFAVNKNVAIRAQYEDFGTVGDSNTTGTTKLTMLSAGVMFMF